MAVPRFLSELKRRNVYRIALVYAGVGWVLLEFADVAFPRLGLPDWTVNFVLALVLFGFPFAIVFAWIFDLNTRGIVRTEPIPVEAKHRFSITSIVEFVVICVLVVTVGYLYVERLSLQKMLVEPVAKEKAQARQPADRSPEKYRAIAVLPFTDMSESRDQAWFAEGVAEELLLALSQVDELKVMARTSSFAFKETDKTITEIAEILDVQAVLEGSVRKSGDRVKITAQLIDVKSGYHIWSESYERQLDDIFELQDELAKSIVNTLRVELGVASTAQMITEETRSPEAYNWFMRGRAIYDWSDPRTLFQGIEYFEKAVELDPDYAMAWGWLAFALSFTGLWQSFDEAGSEAIMAYEKALTLDPGQSEALATKALFTLLIQHDWLAAGRLYQQAMESKANTLAMGSYAIFYLQHINEEDRAIQLYSDAEKRDPLQAGHKANLANIYFWNGNAQAAAEKAREALALKPEHIFALMALIEAYTALGNYSGVEQILNSMPSELQKWPTIRARAGLFYLATGKRHKAREIYNQYKNNPPFVGASIIAALALELGEMEKAIDLMETEVERRGWTQLWARSPYFAKNDALNANPRYQQLLKRIGLDDDSIAELHKNLSFD